MAQLDMLEFGSNAQHIANSLHGCRLLRFRPAFELVVKIVTQLADKLQVASIPYKAMHVSSSLLMCFHLVCAPSSDVLHVLLQRLCKASDVHAQAAANALYAICGLLHLEQDQATLQKCLPLLQELAGMCKEVSIQDTFQLLQAHQACAAMGVDQLLPARLLDKCLRMVEQHPPDKTSSKLQREVVGVLHGLDNIKHVSTEHTVLMGASSVDALCTTGSGVQVMVEVEGPVHFFTNQPRVYDGSTRLKHALLRHQGHALVSLHYADWNACKGNAARHALLTQLVEDAVAGW